MLARKHENARLQSLFYRDQYRRTLNLLIVAMIIMFLLIGGILYLVLFNPDPNYYANTTNGIILAMPPHS